MARALSLALLAVLAWWPGGTQDITSSPTYPRRVYVIDTIGVRERRAMKEWNACGARIRLVRGPQALAETPGTITILDGLDELPRGGWTGDHGVLFLPGGSWTRSRSTIAHELGHAMGFGHASFTRSGSVMGGAARVQPRDCEGLRAYYGAR